MESELKSYQQVLLNNVFAQKLEQNERQTKIITDYKKRHQKVIEGLQVYPLSISENCMVPIGKRAFMKGKLVHTNEILASLGDGYFAKYSASQAIALCNRRITWADEILKSLEMERNLYEMRQYLPLEHDIFGEEDRKDIVEHWTENKLDEWRVQHRQREKEYHHKLAQLREKEKTDIRTQEDFFKRLDELEIEEELEDEICRLEAEQKKNSGDFEFFGDLEDNEVYDESEEDVSDSSETDNSEEIREEIQEELKKLKAIQISKRTTVDMSNVISDAVLNKVLDKNAAEDEQTDFTENLILEKLKESCSPKPGEVAKDTNTKEKRRISFAEPCIIEDKGSTEEIQISQEPCSTLKRDNAYDENSEDEDDIIRIEFSHSSHILNICESNNMEIQSPLDIYKMINVPKSILKRSPNDMIVDQVPPPSHEDSSSTDTEDEYVRHSAYNSVIKEKVQESQTSASDISTKDEKRIVSKFKLERAKRKK
ncbi:unconventional prefoldin RPB5 interactor-like protein [Monomorium pharaonis]|uniref:unconventional prefoldin RPB5 interactor-like protein n=1 Tax=Monomorium pharaonis TaxID=307658 RepID=UPI00063F3457|nr:unconventional prefoldin RPB5 interactor-like protein [Monomorium pharaonis]